MHYMDRLTGNTRTHTPKVLAGHTDSRNPKRTRINVQHAFVTAAADFSDPFPDPASREIMALHRNSSPIRVS